jgi:hypothetical protein
MYKFRAKCSRTLLTSQVKTFCCVIAHTFYTPAHTEMSIPFIWGHKVSQATIYLETVHGLMVMYGCGDANRSLKLQILHDMRVGAIFMSKINK